MSLAGCEEEEVVVVLVGEWASDSNVKLHQDAQVILMHIIDAITHNY
jgi:hypothetical protein